MSPSLKLLKQQQWRVEVELKNQREKLRKSKGNREIMDLRRQPIEPGAIQAPTRNMGPSLGPTIKAN